MDEELYQAFITESEESITQLNNSLLSLESNPDDTEAIDDIFRQAHTLKGNFGAMGFDNAATVAHAVEDLLDEIRHERLDVTAERMDLVFDGVDLIVDIVDDIEEHGESGTETDEMVEELRAVLEEGAAAAGDTETTDDGSSDSDESLTTDAGVSDADIDGDAVDERVLQAEVVSESRICSALTRCWPSSPSRGGSTFSIRVRAVPISRTASSRTRSSCTSTAPTRRLSTPNWVDWEGRQLRRNGRDRRTGQRHRHRLRLPTIAPRARIRVRTPTRGRRRTQRRRVKSVRVDVDQLDELHELVEQLVTSRIKLTPSTSGQTTALHPTRSTNWTKSRRTSRTP